MIAEPVLMSLSKAEGAAWWFNGCLNIIKATSASTGGAFALIHQTAPPGNATPYHLHQDEDEAFYVLDGEFTFISDGQRVVLGPGGYIFLPRKRPHGFRCTGSAPSTMLVLAMPGNGFVGMMTEAGEPARELTLPQPAPPDVPRLVALCAKYRVDVLGPLPD